MEGRAQASERALASGEDAHRESWTPGSSSTPSTRGWASTSSRWGHPVEGSKCTLGPSPRVGAVTPSSDAIQSRSS